MKCFYHGDADGQVSATWVFDYELDNKDYTLNEEDFIMMQYDIVFPMNRIEKDERVYIVDFSIQPNEMSELLKITKNVIWIDHHKTAIEKYDDFHYEISGLRYDGVAGCELTWAYLNKMVEPKIDEQMREFNLKMLEDCPMTTRYIGDYDVWKFEFGDATRYFLDGYHLLDNNPYSNDMRVLILEHDYSIGEELIKSGMTVNKYKTNRMRSVVNGYSYEAEFEGHKILVCNSHERTSVLFGDRFEDYDFCSAYMHKGDNFSISLYSKNGKEGIDVSKLAVKYGGGGHWNACGFECKELPFKKIN